MNWTNIRLIWLREVRDQLRDRRTLFMVALLPLLLYPALGIGLMQITISVAKQKQSIVVVGTDQLPEPSLLSELQTPEDEDAIHLITDASDDWKEGFDTDEKTKMEAFLKEVSGNRELIDELAVVQSKLRNPKLETDVYDALKEREAEIQTDLDGWFSDSGVDVMLVIPDGFKDSIALGHKMLAKADDTTRLMTPRPLILHSSARDRSELATQRIMQSISDWESKLLVQRMEQAGLPPELTDPVPSQTVDLAAAAEISANLWSKFLPALLVLFAVTGALYPAIDLGAGEKERGTMETLLISPATRTEIVVGKFFTVMLFSYLTALLNLVSMGFTSQHMLSAIGSARSSPIGDISFPPLTSMVWVVLFALPIAALFSALSLALAMFARSSKEGQYYLTPLLMVALGLTLFTMFPGVELTAYYSVLPVIGPSLLLKALLVDTIFSETVVTYAVPVLVTSCGYSFLALWWAIEQFQREDILFREAERFELGLWIKHLFREKEATPSFTEAGVCFAVIGLLQFVFLTSMQGAVGSMDETSSMLTLQAIYLIATVGTPALLMGLLLTTDVRKSLKLTWPKWSMLAAGIVLPFTLMPISLELMTQLDWFFPPIPPEAERLMAAMGSQDVGFWLPFAAFAIAPAVCEELAFRGFILSGLERSRHKWLPIVISAMLFGVIHLIPKQVFNATLLGLVIGLLAVRSKSLLPGVIFHLIFNGVQVGLSRVDVEQIPIWLVSFPEVNGEQEMHFSLGVLALSGLVSALIIGWLIASWKDEPVVKVDPRDAEGG